MDLYNSIYNIALPFWNGMTQFFDVLKNTTVPFFNSWAPIWDWDFQFVSLLEVTLTTGFTVVLVYRVVRALTV